MNSSLKLLKNILPNESIEEELEDQLIEKLKSQINGTFRTIHNEYEIEKIEDIDLYKLHIENEENNHLDSPSGCKISGTFVVLAQIYPPNINREFFHPFIFKIILRTTIIKFNPEEQTISIEGNINIKGIKEYDNYYN